MKKKRVLNSRFIILSSAILLVLLLSYKIPRFIQDNNLKELGYSKESISCIRQKKLLKDILKNNYYSDYLNTAIHQDDFNKSYLPYYVVADTLNEEAFTLIEYLKARYAYSEEELLKLFQSLEFKEIVSLLVFEKVDVNLYIDDLKDHIIDQEYPLNNFQKEVLMPETIEAYTNQVMTVDYIPTKLAPIPTQIAVENLFLESKALEAYQKLIKAMNEEGLYIYATEAYKDYSSIIDQKLGLSLKLVSIENESLKDFIHTKAYKWLQENGHTYGFIERFPPSKEALTGFEMPYYWRYVGVELASKIKASSLTFDEYYMFYIYKK